MRTPAQTALLRFVQWYAENVWSPAWVVSVETAIVTTWGLDREAYEWLVREAGGWWKRDETRRAAEPYTFVEGSWEDLAKKAKRFA